MVLYGSWNNRAGKDLPAKDRRTLEAAKDELRKAFGKTN
jgi:hypothetical protein